MSGWKSSIKLGDQSAWGEAGSSDLILNGWRDGINAAYPELARRYIRKSAESPEEAAEFMAMLGIEENE